MEKESSNDILKRLDEIHNSSSVLKNMEQIHQNRVQTHQQEMKGFQNSPIPIATNTVQNKEQHPDSTTEFIDTSTTEEGSAFLFWHDSEAEQKWGIPDKADVKEIVQAGFTRSVQFPEKSGVFLAKYVDFKTENEKKTALSHLAEIVSDYENQPESNKKGKYFILLGRLVDVEVKKQIIIK